jgi:Iap family predicted aminopeptidase
MISRLFTLSCLLLLAVLSVTSARQSSLRISTPEEIKAEFDRVPCKNDERLAAVKTLFERMGATEADITVDKYKHAENLVVRKPGATDETIIIGAHYDKVVDGCGAIDNWTGIVAIAHIYQSLKEVSLKKTVLFVAFGNEEKGLVGSHAMAGAIAKEELGRYCAMINIDSLGMAAPQVLDNTSSKKMIQLAETVAREVKIPFGHRNDPGANADSNSFVERKIPALTIHGLNNDWHDILHSPKDQSARINTTGVYLGYRLALSLLWRVDLSSCADYR